MRYATQLLNINMWWLGQIYTEVETYAAQHMINLGYKVLFVCLTNKVSQNNGINGATTYIFVGMTINNEESLSKIDASQYDVIVFDEIYFANVRMLARIKRYADNSPKKIIIATGDTNQLETCDPLVEEVGDQYDKYVNQCIDTIYMILRISNRLKSHQEKTPYIHSTGISLMRPNQS